MRRLTLLAGALLALACSRGRDETRPFRLGFFPNVTHGQALVGVEDGTYARALGGRLETRMFHAGPAAMEALLAGDLDASYVGPGPAVIAFLRSRGEGLRVVAGAVSGGAVLVVRDATRPGDLVGKRVASPQLGNTQDVALRLWLGEHGLDTKRGPRGVEVTPLANPDILSMFARGELAGAWVPEPWGARLVHEAGGKILVDERTRWPDGRLPAAVLVVSQRALERRRPEAVALLRAHLELTRRWEQAPAEFARQVNAALARHVGKPLADAVLKDAFARMAPTVDPMRAQLAKMARDTQKLGFAPPGDVSAIVDETLLGEVARR
jgi:NitT/TauT family transport system substrate-binding protein